MYHFRKSLKLIHSNFTLLTSSCIMLLKLFNFSILTLFHSKWNIIIIIIIYNLMSFFLSFTFLAELHHYWYSPKCYNMCNLPVSQISSAINKHFSLNIKLCNLGHRIPLGFVRLWNGPSLLFLHFCCLHSSLHSKWWECFLIKTMEFFVGIGL